MVLHGSLSQLPIWTSMAISLTWACSNSMLLDNFDEQHALVSRLLQCLCDYKTQLLNGPACVATTWAFPSWNTIGPTMQPGNVERETQKRYMATWRAKGAAHVQHMCRQADIQFWFWILQQNFETILTTNITLSSMKVQIGATKHRWISQILKSIITHEHLEVEFTLN